MNLVTDAVIDKFLDRVVNAICMNEERLYKFFADRYIIEVLNEHIEGYLAEKDGFTYSMVVEALKEFNEREFTDRVKWDFVESFHERGLLVVVNHVKYHLDITEGEFRLSEIDGDKKITLDKYDIVDDKYKVW